MTISINGMMMIMIILLVITEVVIQVEHPKSENPKSNFLRAYMAQGKCSLEHFGFGMLSQ